ncbi:MAG: hypothetical protein FJ104_11185, partial [Deltaproteobacteria bacterium]|nr:hypothetical protein [Deltaproteobacteria bacterium]
MRRRGADPEAPRAGHRAYTDREIYRRLLRHARPYWAHIAGVFVLSLLGTPLALLAPLPVKIVVDNVIGDHAVPGYLDVLPGSFVGSDRNLLIVAVTMLVLIALLGQLVGLASTVLQTIAGERLKFSFRAALFRHAQRLSLSYHDQRGSS